MSDQMETTNGNGNGNSNLLQTTLAPLLQAGTLQTILEYLAKGGAVAGTAYLVENVRGQIQSGFYRSLIQALIFAVLLFLIDYILPRMLPLFGGQAPETAPVTMMEETDEGFADYGDYSDYGYDY